MNRIGLSFFGRFCLAAFAFALPALAASAAVPTLTAPADGATVDIHTPTQRDYLNKTMEERRTIGTNRTEHLKLTVPYDRTRWVGYENAGTFPHPVTLAWSGTGPFSVEIRRTSDSKVFFSTNGLSAKTIDVFNFEIGCQYTWKVSNADGASSVRTFTTDNVFPRLLWDRAPAGEIYGVRELGGCYVSNGAYRVKQGLVFRSSKLNANATTNAPTVPGPTFVSDANRPTWLNDFGVKYELDLRAPSESMLSASPLGSAVTYKNISGIDYSIAGSVSNKKSIKSELDYALDPAHYPLLFHCSIGHDRTGTLAILMHGLLGVSEDDMMRNYESSWFWYCKGTVSGVEGHYKGINTLNEHLSTYAGATMADRIVAYCKDIGIKQSQIDTFRNAMLEPVDAPTPPTTKKVWSVLGDSYSTWAGLDHVTYPYYPTSVELDPSMAGAENMSRTWWSQVISHFDGTLGSVVASGGSRIAEDVLSEPPVGSFEHRAQNGELGDPDYILFMGGLNDKWHDVPTDTMFSAMNSLCAMLNEKYAKAQKIFLLTKLPGTWGCGIPSDYRSALKQAALDHGCTVVDLEGAYTESGTDLIKAHPTARGMTNFANRVIATLEGTYVPPTHVHVWGNWVTNVVPTATTDGQRTGTCTADGCSYPFATTVETLPKTGGVDPTAYGAADKSAVTYTWKAGVSGPWEYTTNWTGSAGATYGIPNNATYATARFPSATTAGTTVALANKTVNVKRLNFENTAAMSLVLDNGKIVEAAASESEAMNVGKTGPVALTFRGAAPQLESKSEFSYRRMYFGELCETRLVFELPATPWTAATAPILASGEGANITFYTNTQFVIDASNLTVPAEGQALTNVLACASGESGGIRPWHLDETLPPAEMTLPPGAEGRLAFDCSNGFVYFILTKQQKAEPTAVAKPTLAATWAKMDGSNHKPTISVEPADAYTVTYSDGGNWSAAGNYTATCRLTDTTRYVWADDTTADVVLTFAVVDTYDYLTTDGNGYVDAGIRPNVKTTRLQAKLRYCDLSVNGMQIGFAESETRAWGFAYWTGMPAGSLQYYSASEFGDYGVTLSTDFRDEGTVHEIELCANTASLDGVAKSGNPNPSDYSEVATNLTLFSRYGTFAGLKADVYALKIWNGETLVRDFIPAKDLNGKATLYDACSNVYMTVMSFSGMTASYSVHNCTTIGVPTVTESLPYDSTTKRPVVASDTYTLGGDATAIVPGAYTVTVTPNSGYTWQDGSRETKSFSWAITGQFVKEASTWGWQTTATIGGQEYHICAFTNSAAWTVPANVSSVDFLVVGGGGAGGASGAVKDYRSGGGGGAGGVVTGRMDVVTGNALTVTVGVGGAAVATAEQAGGNGGESSIRNGADNLVTVSGGGAGGYAASAGTAGSAGGSGGGGSSKNSTTGTTAAGGVTPPTVAGGIVYQSFGYAGGKGYGKQYAGGGGGAGGAGVQNASAPGEGGAGVMLWISGEEAVYAAGGKGGYSQYSDALSEAACTGNGGHGAYRSSSTRYVPTSGGSGIVIIRYVLSSGPEPHEHHYGDWYIKKEPTLEAFGEKCRDCTCGAFETVQLPKLEKWVTVPSGFTVSNTIICLGDSLTHGDYADALTIPATPNYFDGRMNGVTDTDNYPYRLARSVPTNYNVIAQSKGGKTTDAIVSWFGGIPMKTSYKFTLPATTAVVQIPTNILYNGTDGGAQHEKRKGDTGYDYRYYGLLTPYLPLSEPVEDGQWDGLTGWLGGVHVRLGENHATYRTIWRTEPGEATEIPKGATFVPDAQLTYKDAVKVVFAGTNDGKEKADTFLQQIADAFTRTGSERYIVISGHNMYSSTMTTAEESTYEAKFRTKFGDRHFNLRLALIERGVATAHKLGFTSVTKWNNQGATGLLCTNDQTHYNTAGYAVVAQFVKEKLQSLGYLPADPAPVDPTHYGDPDTSAVTYTWKAGVTGPWEYTTNWTASATSCYGIPNAAVATAVFPADLPADTEVVATNKLNVKVINFQNTAAMTLTLSNAQITVAAGSSGSADVEFGKTGPISVRLLDGARIKTLSSYTGGRLFFGRNATTTLEFELGATPWTVATAPLLSAGTDSPVEFYSNTCFVIDAAHALVPAAGQSVTNVLAYNDDGCRARSWEWAELYAKLDLRNCPDGTTGTLVYVKPCLSFVLSRPASGYPTWMDPQDAAGQAKYDAWKSKYGVTDPSKAIQDAYLLNCDNDDTAVEEAKKAFKITGITVGSDGKVTVDKPTGDFNGTVSVRGATSVDGPWELPEGDATARFYKAFLTYTPSN